MEFHEKRPVFQAEQFDGTSASINNLQQMIHFHQYVMEGDNGEICLTFCSGKGQKEKMNEGDWLVKSPSGTFSVISSRQFASQFEHAQEKPAAGKNWGVV